MKKSIPCISFVHANNTIAALKRHGIKGRRKLQNGQLIVEYKEKEKKKRKHSKIIKRSHKNKERR